MLVVRAKIKEIIKEHGDFSVSTDLAEKLDEKAKIILKKACERAKANNRRTVMARDV